MNLIEGFMKKFEDHKFKINQLPRMLFILSQQKLIETLEKHRELELRNIKMCEAKEKEMKSLGAQIMFYQIRMDSIKHAYILKTLKDILQAESPDILWNYLADKYIGQVASKKELEIHAELEKEMIHAHEELLKKIDNTGLKVILQTIVEDEKRHHKMIMHMINNLLALDP